MALISPTFVKSQFIKSFIYHLLFIALLGPMSLMFLVCFENLTFLKNSAFFPASGTLMFFMVQTMQWMVFAGAVGVAIYDRFFVPDECGLTTFASDDYERETLDLYPLAIAAVWVFSRVVVI